MTVMNREQILETFRQLAQSQGFYGRLLTQIDNANEEDREEFLCNLEEQNFSDVVDLVLYLES
jgi:hypothetical protein